MNTNKYTELFDVEDFINLTNEKERDPEENSRLMKYYNLLAGHIAWPRRKEYIDTIMLFTEDVIDSNQFIEDFSDYYHHQCKEFRSKEDQILKRELNNFYVHPNAALLSDLIGSIYITYAEDFDPDLIISDAEANMYEMNKNFIQNELRKHVIPIIIDKYIDEWFN